MASIKYLRSPCAFINEVFIKSPFWTLLQEELIIDGED